MSRSSNSHIVSIDIESTGPAVPGDYSMISLGAVSFDPKTGIGTGIFEANLQELPNAGRDPDTMRFWQRFPKAWKASTKNAQPPAQVMKRFHTWLTFRGNVTALAYPAGFDFTMVYWYLMHFCGSSPFGFSCIDMKTAAATILGLPYKEAAKKRWPKEWFEGVKGHTHVAVEDAVEQGIIYINMMRWAEDRRC